MRPGLSIVLGLSTKVVSGDAHSFHARAPGVRDNSPCQPGAVIESSTLKERSGLQNSCAKLNNPPAWAALDGKGYQNVSFRPNWSCRAPEVPSARLTSEVDCPKVPGSDVRLPGWLNCVRLKGCKLPCGFAGPSVRPCGWSSARPYPS